MPATSPVPLASPPAPVAPSNGLRLLLVGLAVALLTELAPRYEATGALVAPLALALVVALAATALMGWRVLPAVLVGALLGSVHWPMAWPNAQEWMSALTLLAQAAFGGLLLRRSGRADDLALDTRPAIRRLLAAALACGFIGGLLQMLGDMAWSPEPSLRPGTLLLVRAIADSASVVIGLPLLLAFFAPQRERWLPRRAMVAWPLLALLAVMLLAFALINERDRQQALSRFERDAEIVLSRTQSLLDVPLQTLLALRGAFNAANTPLTPQEFDQLSQPWLKRSLGVGSVGWIEVPMPVATPAEAASLTPPSAEANAARATDRAADAVGPPALRHVLGTLPPPAPNQKAAPGATVLELPALRQTAQRAAAQDGPAASPPILLGSGLDAQPGFFVLQSLPPTGTPNVRALAFATITAEALVAPVLAARGDAMRACLFDGDARVELRRLAGPSGCEGAQPGDMAFSREAAFEFGGRRWAMRVSQPVRLTGGVWLFALPALAGGALLAVLLVGMTGQVQRVRTEARTRADELHQEIDLHARDQASHDRTLLAVLDTAQMGMAIVGPDGRIQRANAAFAELAGASAEALRQRTLDEVLVDDERPSPSRFRQLIQQTSDELAHQTLRLRNADGQVTPSLVTLRVLRDDSGRTTSAVCAVHDLSESLRRRQVEKVLGNVMDLSRGEARSAQAVGAGSAPIAEDELRLLSIARDGSLADALRNALHDRPSAVLASAVGGPEGLYMARSTSPQVVLLELDLPDADGLAIMRTLSQQGLPVVALSRDLRPARIDEAFAAGARAYLTLPPEARELLAVLDDLA